MKKLNPKLLFLPFLLSLLLACHREQDENVEEPKNTEDALFTLLHSTETKVNFQNRISEGSNTNILMYEYFYNGGGVAAADFNNDGLEDLYFTANMSDNKLYLNNGDFIFQDITNLAKVNGRPGPWKTGVSVVDINADGKMDIYLCYSGTLPPAKRVNQLFVNQGNDANGVPIFEEEAEKYGIASSGFSNQAYFFDADLDGDLDMLLLNHNPKNLPILNEAGTKQLLAKGDPEMGLRFFKQEQGKFLDFTVKSGINGSALSYGLGLGISDLNQDGWPDFYVSNDYSVPDYLYINQKNGSFLNQIEDQMGHTSQFSMGNDIADINNDGLMDVFTLDMLPEGNKRQKLLLTPDNFNKFDLNRRSGFYYQYMRNMLQLNNGNGTFSEVGQQFGVSNTDWSWAALLADFDNDGWKDLFVSNGCFRDYTNQDFIKYMDNYVQKKGRLTKEDVLEIISHMPSSNVVNYAYRNENGQKFSDKTKAWGLDISANSNGAIYADLDNDGDLDLVVNNINQEAFIYRNESKNNFLKIELKGSPKNLNGIGAVIKIKNGAEEQRVDQSPVRGYLSSVSPILNVGLGKHKKIDSLYVKWPDGKEQWLVDLQVNRTLTLNYADALAAKSIKNVNKPIFQEISSPIAYFSPTREARDYDRQALLINELSFEGPCMTKADVNGDGLEDVFVGGGKEQPAQLFIQNSLGTFKLSKQSSFELDRISADMAAVFEDINGDGFIDLYVCSGGYHDFKKEDPALQDRIYFNDGKGNFKRADVLPQMLTSTASVSFNDINNDGLVDIFVGGRVVPGAYPEPPRSYILMQEKSGKFIDKTLDIAESLSHFGMITAAEWIDLDKDKVNELLIVGEWLPISVFKNIQGKLVNKTTDFLSVEYVGWWNTLKLEDINNDGYPDILAGNMGNNTQFKASKSQPLELIFDDFDQNGSIDPIFSFYIQGKSYPYLIREELLGQLPQLKVQFNTFESYSEATLDKILSNSEMAKARHLKANFMFTALLLSDSNGKYTIQPLPQEAQYAPVYAIEIFDYNKDGQKDLFLAGNNSHSKLRFGKFDANYGQLLRGDGNGKFQYVNQKESGFNIWGDVRASLWINNQLIVGRNGNRPLAYKLSPN